MNDALAWADDPEEPVLRSDWVKHCRNWIIRGERMKRERQAERIDRYGPRESDFQQLGQVLRMVPGGKK